MGQGSQRRGRAGVGQSESMGEGKGDDGPILNLFRVGTQGNDAETVPGGGSSRMNRNENFFFCTKLTPRTMTTTNPS